MHLATYKLLPKKQHHIQHMKIPDLPEPFITFLAIVLKGDVTKVYEIMKSVDEVTREC